MPPQIQCRWIISDEIDLIREGISENGSHAGEKNVLEPPAKIFLTAESRVGRSFANPFLILLSGPISLADLYGCDRLHEPHRRKYRRC